MKLTNKQRKELEVIKYFIPSWVNFDSITDENIRAFFGWSDKGIKYALNLQINNGLAALHYGKQYRDLQITSWGKEIEDGIITKHEILSELPREITSHIEQALDKAMLGKPMFEAINGETVLIGYEKPEAIDFRHKFGKSIL